MPLRHFLANAFFSALLEPGSGLEDMILQMKGIALEYAIVRYSLFLCWMHDGSGKLPYETVRDYQVIIIHMTGYDAEVIWDWLRIRTDD